MKIFVPKFLKQKKGLPLSLAKSLQNTYFARISHIIYLEVYFKEHFRMVVSEFHCATLNMSNVNCDCDVEIIISGNKPPVLLNEVFIKKIRHRIILHL